MLLGSYLAYTIYLILDATDNPNLDEYSSVVLYVVLPLTLIGLAVTVLRAMRTPAQSEA